MAEANLIADLVDYRSAPPHVVIRRGLSGEPVHDRVRVRWSEAEPEIVVIDADYAEMVRRRDVVFYVTLASGVVFTAAVLFTLILGAGQ